MDARAITVLPVLFKGRKKDGDFKYMAGRPEHANSLALRSEAIAAQLLHGPGTDCHQITCAHWRMIVPTSEWSCNPNDQLLCIHVCS